MKKYQIALLTLMAYSALAVGDTFENWVAAGSGCSGNDVEVISMGDSLSVLFNRLYVDMPASAVGDGLNARKTCTFRVQFNPPQGFYLAGLKQLLSGGVIKSAGSSVRLQAKYNVGAIAGAPLALIYPTGLYVSPSDENSVFAEEYENDLGQIACGARTNYGLNLTVTAARTGYREFVQAGFDSADGELSSPGRLILIPHFSPCRH